MCAGEPVPATRAGRPALVHAWADGMVPPAAAPAAAGAVAGHAGMAGPGSGDTVLRAVLGDSGEGAGTLAQCGYCLVAAAAVASGTAAAAGGEQDRCRLGARGLVVLRTTVTFTDFAAHGCWEPRSGDGVAARRACMAAASDLAAGSVALSPSGGPGGGAAPACACACDMRQVVAGIAGLGAPLAGTAASCGDGVVTLPGHGRANDPPVPASISCFSAPVAVARRDQASLVLPVEGVDTDEVALGAGFGVTWVLVALLAAL